MFRRRAADADVGLDLGSRHIRAISSSGHLIEVPAFALPTPQGWVVGRDATGHPQAPRQPFRDGRLQDPEALTALIQAASQRLSPFPRHALVALPQPVYDVDLPSVAQALPHEGPALHSVVHTHLAAAVGADLPVMKAEGSMVVIAGSSRVEVAVLSLGGTVVYRSVAAGLDAMDAAISALVRREGRAVLSRQQVHQIRRDVVDASHHPVSRRVMMTGRRLDDGRPIDLDIDGAMLSPALNPVLEQLTSTVLGVLRETPAELCADLVDRGIILLGGGATQRGLDARIQARIGLPVLIPDRPAQCMTKGLHHLLHDARLRDALVQPWQP